MNERMKEEEDEVEKEEEEEEKEKEEDVEKEEEEEEELLIKRCARQVDEGLSAAKSKPWQTMRFPLQTPPQQRMKPLFFSMV